MCYNSIGSDKMIDLHMHTTYTDGEFSPIEMLKKCEELKLECISITDHDKCLAYDDFSKINISDYYTGKLIPGVELTTNYKGRTIEILGYGIKPMIIQEWYDTNYPPEKKKIRIEYSKDTILASLAKMGIVIEKASLDTDCAFDVAIYRKLLLDKERNEEILGKELLHSIKNFFRLGISNPDSPLFVDVAKFRPTPMEITNLIHSTGGKCFLAHPWQYAFPDVLVMIDELRSECDLDGIECFHSTFSKDEMDKLVEYARSNNLLISGGSDFHGTLKPDIKLGTGTNNNLNITIEYVDWCDNL